VCFKSDTNLDQTKIGQGDLFGYRCYKKLKRSVDIKFEPFSFITKAQNIDNNPITPTADCYMLTFQQQGQGKARKTVLQRALNFKNEYLFQVGAHFRPIPILGKNSGSR